MERRKFTREFKLEAVRLIKERGVSYAQASHDLSVHQSQLRSGGVVLGIFVVSMKKSADDVSSHIIVIFHEMTTRVACRSEPSRH